MTYFNCTIYPDEVGKPMEDSTEIIIRADTFQSLIEKMGEIINLNRIYDRFVLRYMASTENGCYVLNNWRFDQNEMAALIRRNLYV